MARVITATLRPPAKSTGLTHWSSRARGKKRGIGNATVARIWREHGIQPWRSEGFRFSTDPESEAKVSDVAGLYLDPALHRQLQQDLPPIRVDQNRRPDPHEHQASNDFRNTPLAGRASWTLLGVLVQARSLRLRRPRLRGRGGVLAGTGLALAVLLRGGVLRHLPARRRLLA